MSNEYSPSGSRRSPRRGDRRPRRGDRPNHTSARTEGSQPAKKKSLIEKIVGFFGGKPEAKSRQPAAPTSARPAPRREDRPSRGERPTGMRKPEIVEVTSARLYVGNLSFDAAESDLSELFSGVGTVQNVEIVMNRHTMKSKGFGFVQMQSVEEAKRAVTELHDKEYMGGRKLVVSGAKAVEERRSERNRSSEDQPELLPEQ
ncbi:MAG: RNA-binding protein [Verrucomicrobiae bacterium]